MVSFDVVSLFTKVPLREAMLYISDLLHDDETLEDGTKLPLDVISVHLLKFASVQFTSCSRTIYMSKLREQPWALPHIGAEGRVKWGLNVQANKIQKINYS